LLDKTRVEYKEKVAKDKALLTKVVTQLMRNKTILKQAKERACKKALYLADSLREASNKVNAQGALGCPAAAALVSALLAL
jgi:hypothetical protein